MHELEVGDTVVIRAVVTQVKSSLYFHATPEQGHLKDHSYYTDQVCEVVKKPWEPKVGDTVFHIGWIDGYHKYAPSHPQGVTLLYIHRLDTNMPERHWAVVAYKSGIPKVVKFSDLRKEFSDV